MLKWRSIEDLRDVYNRVARHFERQLRLPLRNPIYPDHHQSAGIKHRVERRQP